MVGVITIHVGRFYWLEDVNTLNIVADVIAVTVIAQLPTHSFGMLQNQPKCGSLSNPLENQLAVG